MIKKVLLFIFLFLICFSVKAIEIDSKYAVIVNLNTNSIVYEKSKDERVPVASLNKIITALTTIEKIEDLNQKVIIDRSIISNIDYDVLVLGLKDEEEVTYYDLLAATMLRSAGDAAKYLANITYSSEEEFINKANEMLKEIGLENTVYKDPIGLEQEGQYSTASDIAKLLEYALKNPTFKEIFYLEHYKTTDEAFEFDGPKKKAKDHEASYILGAKTGYTTDAGLCLASYVKNNKEEFIVVTLNANEYTNKEQNFIDQKHIMDYYIENYELKKIINKNDIFVTVKTSFGEEISIKSEKDVYSYERKDSKIEYKYDGITKVTTKNKNGDLLGKYIVSADDNVIYENNVYLNKKVSIYIPEKVRYIILGCFILLIIIMILRKRKRYHKRY